jgi:hypothetical protein
MLGNQTRQALQSFEREYRLRWALGHLVVQLGPELRSTPEIASALTERVQRTVTLLHLSYRPARHEAGPEKPFDFSRAILADRWQAGSVDTKEGDPLGSVCRASSDRDRYPPHPALVGRRLSLGPPSISQAREAGAFSTLPIRAGCPRNVNGSLQI